MSDKSVVGSAPALVKKTKLRWLSCISTRLDVLRVSFWGRKMTKTTTTNVEELANIDDCVNGENESNVEDPFIVKCPPLEPPPLKSPAAPPRHLLLIKRIWFITSPIFLVLQNSASSLLLRYMKLNKQKYFFVNTSIVFFAELFKVVISLFLFAMESRTFERFRERAKLQLNLFSKESSKSIVPSAMYCVQNNLLLVAISNLDAATFQVSYQLKIFTVAMCLRLMLKKHLNLLQWLMLAQLFAGIVVVQTSNLGSKTQAPETNLVLGFLAVAGACIVSGFSGVYSEKLLKQSNIGTWARNVQFALYGSIITGITMCLNDWKFIRENGVSGGYQWLTWLVVVIQGIGGLLVAVVIKTHDNIIKGFSNAAAILVSTVFGVMFLDTKLSIQFIIGMLLVSASIVVYLNAKAICVRIRNKTKNRNDQHVENNGDDKDKDDQTCPPPPSNDQENGHNCVPKQSQV